MEECVGVENHGHAPHPPKGPVHVQSALTDLDRRSMLAAGVAGIAAFASSNPANAAQPVVRHPSGATGIIDVHTHFVPDAYRSAASAAGHVKPDGMPALPAWSEAEMLAMMNRLGIGTAILSISSPGVHFGNDAAARQLARTVNTEAARLKSAHPARFGFFASLPLPDVEGALAEVTAAFDKLGADGVILESNSGGIYPGDPRFDPVYAELNRRGAVVLLHPTSPHCPGCIQPGPTVPAPVLEFMFETTRAVTNLVLTRCIERYPQIRFIIPHAGAAMPVLVDRIAMAAAIMPGMAGTSPDAILATLRKLHFDLAGAPVPRLLTALRSFADPEHLLYGSDWPFTPEAAVTKLLARLKVSLASDGDAQAIFSGNARRLFPQLVEPGTAS
ncbi:amidohydrolase family protein [Sphingobium sp. SCG-1]|uniref:amidohydrolase family protein n=1 Tax=Sphingobium sp. SCG-1 TaxID=2072936 RepID=UPI001CB9A65F|nr:amidohydrolase family protein [Sphingobium sp. SCG-1]